MKSTDLFNTWYNEYYVPLLKFLAGYAHDAHDREDIAQDTFTQVWRKIDQFEHKAEPFTWICAIGINTARRHFETRERQMPTHYVDPMVIAYDEEEEMIADLASPEEVLIAEQTAEQLARTLQRLPARQAEVLSLFYYHGKTYDEISEALDISMNTVHTHLQRAREYLNSFIGEHYARSKESAPGGEGATIEHTGAGGVFQ